MRVDDTGPAADEAPDFSVLPDPEDVLTEGRSFDDLPEVEEEEEQDATEGEGWLDDDDTEAEAPAAPPAAADPPVTPAAPGAPTYEGRLNAALDAIGADRDAYLAQLEQMARDPEALRAPAAPQATVEEEVSQILQADPEFMEAYQILQSGEPLASRAEELALRQVVRLGHGAATARVQLARQAAQQEQLTRQQTERAELDRVAGLPRFEGYLKNVGDQRGLLAFARQHGIANMEVAASAYFSEREFQRGRTTQTKARRAATPTGSQSATPRRTPAEKDPEVPAAVIKEGAGATLQWMMKHAPDTIKRRLGKAKL